ncbi:zinc finger protein ZAT5-like [Euphorbia lathyris]|uniref:zinc finger protein ZAT5-like n=1 Tax=Euphorbia lathyris TaxID=212925 RepID=UPI003314484D
MVTEVEVAEAQELIIGLSSFKGKRTKRQRPVSPLGLTVSSSSGSGGSGAGDLRIITTPSTSIDDNYGGGGGGGEEEDMANCLILLAQGSREIKKFSEVPPAAVHTKPSALESGVYRCKTCNRSFSSFQALGGHRASHKKPVNKFGNDGNNNKMKGEEFGRRFLENTSTTLSLQISNNNNSNSKKANNSNKVHECSVCGAEFSSGQALGGHMRRHRPVVSSSCFTTTTSTATVVAPASSSREGQSEFQESKKRPRNCLDLDLNLPAETEEENLVRESKFQFPSKEQVLVFSANSSLVNCHY